MSLRRLDEFAFVYEKVASYANFRASFSSVLIMAEESSHSQDLNNAFIIERTPTKGTKRKKYTLDFKCKVIEAAKNCPSFDRKVDTALDKCIVPEDSHIENELYLIDTDDES